MNDPEREKRVEEYRTQSVKADDRESRGDRAEALTIVKAQHDLARDTGDEDYRLFFEAEALQFSEPDHKRQIALLQEALDWQATRGIPKDYFLLRSMGVYHCIAGKEDAAVEWLDKAIQANPADLRAIRERGAALLSRGDTDVAIEQFDKVLVGNPHDGDAMRERGVALAKLGQIDEALKCLDAALEINPQDWNTMRTRGAVLSREGNMDAAMEWFDKALQVNPMDASSIRERGAVFAEKGMIQEAFQCLDKALALDPNDVSAMRYRAVVLLRSGLYEEAIEWCDRALSRNPGDLVAMQKRALALARCKRHEEALAWLDRVLREDPKDFNTMRNCGAVSSVAGDHARALELYRKALEVNPKDHNSHISWAFTAFNTARPEEALEHIREAARLAPEKSQDHFRSICLATGHDPDEEWRNLFPEPTPAMHGKSNPPPPTMPKQSDPFADLRGFIANIREGYGQQADDFLQRIRDDEEREREFLEPESHLDPDLSLVMVLRKWNSFTPAIPTAEDERSRGGGYFVWHNGKGTVIDPGYSFLENFHEAGCRICDIDSVILTHAHNDHTIEFESLRTLLHQFNDKVDGARKKRVDFYLSNGAFIKFGGLLDLKDWDYTNHVATLNSDGRFELAGGIHLRILTAYHDDLIARDQSVGLSLTVPVPSGSRHILFTSDTGLFPLQKNDRKPKPDTKGPEVWETYQLNDNNRPDLMVIHIGSVRETEFKMQIDEDPKEICYANHLGIIGTARLITQCRPKLAVVSEFGEEMRTFRCPLVRGLRERVIEPVLKERDEGEIPGLSPGIPSVVPGDLPFVYDIQGHRFWCVLNEKWIDATKIDFERETTGEELRRSVYYFSHEDRANFASHEKSQLKVFKNRRAERRSLYFKHKA